MYDLTDTNRMIRDDVVTLNWHNETLTRESHELMLTGLPPIITPCGVVTRTFSISILHSGQWNITTSILFILTESRKLKVISVLIKFLLSVNSWLAHIMLAPSSPVSVGMLPSNRTLVVGSAQIVMPPLVVTLAQCPVAEDPFTDTTSVARKEKLDGMT
jgi:hypothetical protein